MIKLCLSQISTLNIETYDRNVLYYGYEGIIIN